MSKKKAVKKKAPAKAAKSKPKAKSAPLKTIKRSTSPRSQALPGMEQVRHKPLDRICEAISDVRADLNRLRGEEKDLQGQAVREMSGRKVTAYRFAGVELVLVPGDMHLRVRTLKTSANTDGPIGVVIEEEAPPVGGDSGVTADEVDEQADAADLEG